MEMEIHVVLIRIQIFLSFRKCKKKLSKKIFLFNKTRLLFTEIRYRYGGTVRMFIGGYWVDYFNFE
jgi:hypothetical protein